MRIDEECVEVDFACSCMTFDGSSKKYGVMENIFLLTMNLMQNTRKRMMRVAFLEKSWK